MSQVSVNHYSLWIAMAILVVMFNGEPDIADAIIHALMTSEACK